MEINLQKVDPLCLKGIGKSLKSLLLKFLVLKGIYFFSCLYFLKEFTLPLQCLENFCFLFYFINSIQFSHHNGDKKKQFSKNLIKALPHRSLHLEVHDATKFDLIGTLTQTDRQTAMCGQYSLWLQNK